MEKEAQSSAEQAQLAAMVAHFDVAMLTTLDADGALVSQPMAHRAMDGHGALWFFIARDSVQVGHLRVVNVSFTDAHQAIYVSISGYGEIHDDPQRIRKLWTPFARPWFPAGPESGHLVLLKVVPRTAEYWGEAQSRMVRLLANPASAIAGRPVGLRRNDRFGKLG